MTEFDGKFQSYDDFDASDNSDEHWEDVYNDTSIRSSDFDNTDESEVSLDDLIPKDLVDYELDTKLNSASSDFVSDLDSNDESIRDLDFEMDSNLGFNDDLNEISSDIQSFGSNISQDDLDVLNDLMDNNSDSADLDDSDDVEIEIQLPESLMNEISNALGNLNGDRPVDEPSLDEVTARYLEGHMHIYSEGEELVSDVYEGETNVSDEDVAMFLDSTEEGNKQALVPESSITVEGPSFVLKRVTVEEIAFYKRHGLIKSANDDETLWNLLCDIEGTVMFLGKVENTLRTYLMLKQLYPQREVYCRGLDGMGDVLVEPEDLSFMLLEDLNFTKE